MPKKLHAIIQMYLLMLLKSTLPEEYRVLPELNVICGGERIVPDITVYQRRAKFIDGDLADQAVLAVEIASWGTRARRSRCQARRPNLGRFPLLFGGEHPRPLRSPKQTFSDLLAKCERLVEAGTLMTWIILPEKRQAWTFSGLGLAQATETLGAGLVEVGLAEMWDEMERE